MSSFTRITSLVALLVLFSCMSLGNALPFNRPVHIKITNNLGNGLDLTHHCKSREDDLGEHLLHQEKTYSFSFRPNIFGKTLFYCSVSWNGQVRRFNIFESKRDECHRCNWSIYQSNLCVAKDPYFEITCYDYKE